MTSLLCSLFYAFVPNHDFSESEKKRDEKTP